MPKADDNIPFIFMVNAVDSKDADIEESVHDGDWEIKKVDDDWKPQDGIPASDGDDIILIFAKRYKEEETLHICQEIRSNTRYDSVPILAAISMYEMPLGNQVKKLDNSETIFTPITKEDLTKKVAELTESA